MAKTIRKAAQQILDQLNHRNMRDKKQISPNRPIEYCTLPFGCK
jgi:hypothetical protein